MRAIFVLLALAAANVLAVPRHQPRIVGGSLTVISQYPFTASLLYSPNLVTYSQACGGTILTTTAILTAAHCVYGDATNRWRARVGSSYANSGGAVYSMRLLTIHSGYNSQTSDNDVAVLRTSTSISYVPNAVANAAIAGSAYVLNDNEPVWAVGWGTTASGGTPSEQLRHVQIWSVNQTVCRTRYAELGWPVTDNMLCSGWLDVGGRDQCQGDSGGPLIHNNVIVGVCSWGYSCATARYPGVNTRVSRFTSWIQSAAA